MSQNLAALRSLVQTKQPCDSYDISWLELAVSSNMPGLVGLQLRYRCYPGLAVCRALQTAIDKGCTAVATMLIEHGVDVTEEQRVALVSMTHLQLDECHGSQVTKDKQDLKQALTARGLYADEEEDQDNCRVQYGEYHWEWH
jgi:hypothetical protein